MCWGRDGSLGFEGIREGFLEEVVATQGKGNRESMSTSSREAQWQERACAVCGETSSISCSWRQRAGQRGERRRGVAGQRS